MSKETSVKAGDDLTLTDTVWEGTWVVPGFCPDQPTPAGQWYCVTHNEGFANNLQADGHCMKPGTHRMVWLCFLHGPEGE